MNTHETPELLSSYLDGELDDGERRSIEAHLASCASCSQVVGALRATVAEMRALEHPEPVGSAALRAAIARARSRGKRVGRWSAAVAGAAAAMLGIAAITLNGGSPATEAQLAAVPATEEATDYDSATARALLLPHAEALRAEPDTTAPKARENATFAATDNSPIRASGSGAHGPAIANCDRITFEGTTEPRTLERAIVATYESKPAYLLVYLIAPGSDNARRELWVLARPGCDPLYWHDAAA